MFSVNQFIEAKEFGINAHKSVNHNYDTYLPYEFHLRMVYKVAQDFQHLIRPEDRYLVLAACFTHDVLEDVHSISFADLKRKFGEELAEITYALTNEKGRTRKERANDKYYTGIRETRYAPYVKLCDRIANVQYSKLTGSRQFEMYREEHEYFVVHLTCPETNGYDGMFDYLKSLFEE